jgi:hypothetical protein
MLIVRPIAEVGSHEPSSSSLPGAGSFEDRANSFCKWQSMKTPTIAQFVLRVGGVFALFVAVISFTAHYFPGYEGKAVVATSIAGIALLLAHQRLKSRAKLLRHQSRWWSRK